MFSSQQKIAFALSVRGFFVCSKSKFKVKLLLIDCYWYQWNWFLTIHHNKPSYLNCLKHITSFSGLLFMMKNVKMNPLKVRTKLCTQIPELLWLTAAELQRKKSYNRMKEKSAKPDQRSEWRSLERPI